MNPNKQAFTLIELLVVVLIIGILAAVALPQYQAAVAKSRYAILKNLVKSIATAQEVYYLANGDYTAKLEDLDIEWPQDGELNETGNKITYTWGHCGLSDKDAAACQNKQVNLSYQLYYVHTSRPNRTNCVVADNTNSIAHKVCKAETGRENPTWSNTEASSYRYNEE